jgi:nucleoside-diphosphate-sugar epimerase
MGLDGKRVLVTGGTGYVGGAVVRDLLDGGATVTALVRDQDRARALADAGAKLVEGDLGEGPHLAEACRDADAVIHLAARAADVGSMEDFRRDNVDGSLHLAQAAQAAGVRRFVHVSTISVYGFTPPEDVDEDTAVEPFVGHYPYAQSKLLAERGLRDAELGDMELVIARIGSVFGPGSVHWTLRPARLMAKSPVGMMLIDGGRGMHNYVYIDNVSAALADLITLEGVAGQTFNVTDGHMSYADFFGAYAARAPSPVRMREVSRGAALVLGAAMEATAKVRRRPPLVTRIAVRLLCRNCRISSARLDRLRPGAERVPFAEGMDRSAAWLGEQGIF